MMNPPPQTSAPWTIGRLLAWTEQHFEAQGVDEPRLSAQVLLAEALGCRKIDLYARFDQEPTADQRAAFRAAVRTAAEHRPIAYLVGHKEFYSLDFKVTPDVLIPRPETELAVERALAWCGDNPRERYDVLDLGTGSGCIAITIAKRQPAAHVLAVDISEPALAVARENAARHGVAARVRCVRADLLDLPADAVPVGGFDLIVSNPPYVADGERDALPRNVRDHEPAVALFAGGDGLEAFRRIAASAPACLKPGGGLIVEVGFTQADAVERIFAPAGRWIAAGRFKDLAGIDRVLQFTLPA
jgi:release factor glutamine methyltransferase